MEDPYDLVDGVLVSRAEMVGKDEHMQITAGLYGSNGRVWINVRPVKGLHGPSIKVDRSSGTTREKSCQSTGQCGEWGRSCSPASGSTTGWRGKAKRRGGLSRSEQGGDGSGRQRCSKPEIETAFFGSV